MTKPNVSLKSKSKTTILRLISIRSASMDTKTAPRKSLSLAQKMMKQVKSKIQVIILAIVIILLFGLIGKNDFNDKLEEAGQTIEYVK